MSELEHHPTLAPSSFPALSQCSCYVSDMKDSPEQNRGKAMHYVLQHILEGNTLGINLFGLSETEIADVRSAVKQIHQIFDDHEIYDNNFFCEKRVELRDPDFNIITFGTVDVLSKDGSVLIDFKSNDFNSGDYEQQINCYAYIVMETYNLGGIHTYIVYPNYKDYRYINYDYAKSQFLRIYNNVNDPNKRPVPCEYCHQCKKGLTCEAYFSLPIKIGELRDDYPFELGLSTCHASQIQEPETMSRLLQFSSWLAKFIDSIKYHASEMAKAGKQIPGYKLQERKGRADIIDIELAKQTLGLTEEEFLKICSLSLKDLSTLYAKKNNISEAKAKQKVEDLLSDNLVYSASSQALVRERKPKQKKQIGEQPQEIDNSFEEIMESK